MVALNMQNIFVGNYFNYEKAWDDLAKDAINIAL